MTTRIDEEDFLAQLLQLINEGNKQEAVENILELSDDRQLDIIGALVALNHKAQNIRLYLVISKMCNLIHGHSYIRVPLNRRDNIATNTLLNNLTDHLSIALSLAREPARYLDLSIDDALYDALTYSLDSKLDQELEPELDHDLTLEGDRARAIVRTLDRAMRLTLTYARNLDRDLDRATAAFLLSSIRIFLDIQNIISLMRFGVSPTSIILQQALATYYQKLAGALDEGLHLQQQERSDILDVVIQVLESLLKGNLRHITLEGDGRIIPNALTHQIGPYLQALNGYLGLYAEITGKSFDELRIVQIHNLDAKLEVIGIGDSIRALNEVFNRRKREDEARLREIEIQVKGFERDLLQKENEQKYAQMALEQPIRESEVRAHLENIKTKAIETQIELRRKILELQQLEDEFLLKKQMSYLEEATKFIERIGPNLSFEERFLYITRLATHLQQMDDSDLKARFGSHDSPRPALPDVPPPGLPKPSK